MKTFCFKLYNSRRNSEIMRLIDIAGLIYNHCIALHRRYYRLYGKYIHKNDLQKHLTKLKRSEHFAYMKILNAQAVQNVVERIDLLYFRFWKNLKRGQKASPPKFRKVRKYRSFTLKQYGWSLDEANGKIRIGQKWYRYFKSRNIEGRVKTVTVKRDTLGDIYVYLCCETQCEIVGFRSGQSVGLDFGLKRFLTASDGNDIESPDFFALNAKYIGTAHRKISWRKPGSRNFERARLELCRAYRKLFNQRHDFHFKTARRLCEKYAVICLEDLNIKAMTKTWGRKIQSLGFSYFVKILLYEATKFGTRIIFIDRFYPSSQICSECGYKNEAVKDLRVREWDCPSCGTHHDRDRNAAKNILRVGTATPGRRASKTLATSAQAR